MSDNIEKDNQLECYKCKACHGISFYILRIDHHAEITTIQCRECARIYEI